VPDVSIVMPVYNAERYVGAAVDGVLTGVGIGLSVALVVLLVGAAMAALRG
jgi:hypothetical protein